MLPLPAGGQCSCIKDRNGSALDTSVAHRQHSEAIVTDQDGAGAAAGKGNDNDNDDYVLKALETRAAPPSARSLHVSAQNRLAETCAWIIRTATQLAAHCQRPPWPPTRKARQREEARARASQIDIFNLLGAMPRIYQQMKAIVTRAWRWPNKLQPELKCFARF